MGVKICLRKELRLMAFQNNMVRRIFGTKKRRKGGWNTESQWEVVHHVLNCELMM
jgi:hypothetical protein